MQNTRLLFWLIGILLISSAVIIADPQKDYMISYTYKNPDGTVFRIIKYYMLDGDKFRSEYISTVQYKISATAEANTVLSDSANSAGQVKSEANMHAENISNPEPYTIEILRNDKKLVWSMDPPSKTYIEVPLRQEPWENASSIVFADSLPGSKKIGETKLLNYYCDIYEIVQTFNKETWTSKLFVAKNLNAILKTELRQNGKLTEIMEATEFSMEKPAKSLFEVSEGFQKNENNQN